jgi:SAM-dependent methyltransferase
MSDFNPQSYWSERLDRSFSIGGVGWLGLGESFNRWAYRVRRRIFLRTARGVIADMPTARVLDVGTGTGFYVERWHELGAREVFGADLTDVAVERLRARYPGDSFVQLDVAGDVSALPAGQFDAVSIMDVLYHVVDDDGYARSIANLNTLLRPDGVLILSENLLHGAWQRTEHQVSRDVDWILGLLNRNGFDVVKRRPVFVLMNTPIDSNSRLLGFTWSKLMSLVKLRPRLGSVLGAVLYPLELALTALMREGPSTEIVAARKSRS